MVLYTSKIHCEEQENERHSSTSEEVSEWASCHPQEETLSVIPGLSLLTISATASFPLITSSSLMLKFEDAKEKQSCIRATKSVALLGTMYVWTDSR